MIPMLAMGALSAGQGAMSFISGMGANRAGKRSERLQIWEQQRVEQLNAQSTQTYNDARNLLGNMLYRDPVNWQQFRADGAALGYNPVTWLNSGALSFYSNEAAYKLMAPDAISTSTPMTFQRQPSVGEAIGAAGSSFFSGLTSAYKTQLSTDMQWNMLDRQLSAMGGNRGAASSTDNFGGYNPWVVNANGRTAGGAASSVGAMSALGWPDHGSWKPGKVEVTAWSPFSPVDPYAADVGGAVTQRLGEPGEWFFFGPTLMSDTMKALTGRGLTEWGMANGAAVGSYRQKGDMGIWPSVERWYNDPKTSWSWPLGNLPSPQSGKAGYGSWNTAPLFPGAVAY